MYFTQEDYRCIQNWLQRHAVKDTEIPLTDEIHSNKDSLVIVQNNKNYRIGAIRFLSTVIDNAELNSLSLKTLNADLANVKKLIVESFETKGELIDGYGNNLNNTTEAAKGWSIKQIEPTSEETNVVTKYALTDYNGEYKGDFIKIYKNGDTFVADIYSGTIDDTVDNKTGIPNKKPITESNKALCIILHNGVDSYTISHIPSNTFIDFNFLKVWTGSNAISKLGTIAEGVWEGTPIADAFIASASKWNAKQDALTDTDGSYGQRIKTIESKIPADTTSENPLTNKEFVNSSIATNTATFRGTYTNVNQFPLTGVDDNDYVFLKVMDTEEPTQVLRYDRYKWDGIGWTFEYSLNNSSFTSEQWTAINSGITPELIETFNNKQDLISDLDEIRDNANKGAIAYSWGEHIDIFNEFKWNEDHTAIYIGDKNNPISFYAYGSISAGGFNNTSGSGGGTVIGIKIGDSDPITPIDGILNVPSDVISRSLGLKALAFKDVLSVSDIPTLDISKINGLQSVINAFNAHIDNTIIHITADERTAWNKIASLFGIDEEGDIYLKPDTNGRDRGLYTKSFISSGGKSDTPGTGGGTVVGATVGGVDVELIDGVLKFDAYPTAASLGLGNIAFKDSLTIADIANLQSDLDNKQQAISVISANLSSHIGDSTIHINANERNAWNNKWDYNEATIKAVKVNNAINADNATKLLTPRTIWGQSFDGTGNVSGALTGVTNITASGIVTIAGNVGIGTTSPLYALDIKGTARATEFRHDGPQNRYTKYGQSVSMFMPTTGGWAGGLSWNTNSGDLLFALGYYYGAGINSDLFYFGYGASYTKPVNVILPNGNIGIGTKSPSGKIHIIGQTSEYPVYISKSGIGAHSGDMISLRQPNSWCAISYTGASGVLWSVGASADSNGIFRFWNNYKNANAAQLDKYGNFLATTLEASTSIKIGNATISWDERNGCLKVDKGLYSTDFISSGGFSDAGGTGGGTVVGATVGGTEVKLSGGILEFDAYPTTTSLGLKNLAFKDSLAVSEVVGLQSALSNKQDAATAITTSNYTNYALPLSGGTMANTNVVTNLNADLLDGYHKDDLVRITTSPTSVISLNNVVADGIDFTSWDYDHSVNVNNQPGGNGASSAASVVSFGTDYPFQIYSDYNDTSYLYYRSYYNGTGKWKAWRQFAFRDSNVASASKWATARTITLTGSVTGSVSIDGSANVSLATTTNHTHTFASLAEKPTTISGYGITDAYTASTIDSKLSEYLPLSGGTITNKSKQAPLVINAPAMGNKCGIQYKNGSVVLGYLGFSGVNTPAFKADNTSTWNNIYHSGNLTASVIGNLGTLSNNISGNAETATKLQTPHTIWGQSFDGTGNVSGALTEVTDITASGNATIAGNVGIGTASPSTKLYVAGNIFTTNSITSDDSIYAHGFGLKDTNFGIFKGNVITGVLTGDDMAIFDNGHNVWLWANTFRILTGNLVCDNAVTIGSTLTVSGQATINNNLIATGAVTAGQASDARLKSNIVTVMNACGILRSLRGVEFDWNTIATENCKDLTGHDVGLIAQEVESLIPSAIGTIWGEYKRLDYTKITPYLVEGWKAHDAEIQRLKTKIKQLEERIYGMGRKNNDNTYRNG